PFQRWQRRSGDRRRFGSPRSKVGQSLSATSKRKSSSRGRTPIRRWPSKRSQVGSRHRARSRGKSCLRRDNGSLTGCPPRFRCRGSVYWPVRCLVGGGGGVDRGGGRGGQGEEKRYSGFHGIGDTVRGVSWRCTESCLRGRIEASDRRTDKH